MKLRPSIPDMKIVIFILCLLLPLTANAYSNKYVSETNIDTETPDASEDVHGTQVEHKADEPDYQAEAEYQLEHDSEDDER